MSQWIDPPAYGHSDKFTVQDSCFLDYLQPGDGALAATGAVPSALGDPALMDVLTHAGRAIT